MAEVHGKEEERGDHRKAMWREINNDIRGERNRKKMDKKPKHNKRSVLRLLQERLEGEKKRRKHERRFHFYDGRDVREW